MFMSNYEKIKNNRLRIIILAISFMAFLSIGIIFSDLNFLSNLNSSLNVFYLFTAISLSILYIYLKPLISLLLTIRQNFTVSKKYSYNVFLSEYSIKNITNFLSPITKDNFSKYKSQNVDNNDIRINQLLQLIFSFIILFTSGIFLFLIGYDNLKNNLSFYFYFIFLILASLFIFLVFIFSFYLFNFKVNPNKKISKFVENLKFILGEYIFKKYLYFFILKVLSLFIFLLPSVSIIFLLYAFNINVNLYTAVSIIGVFFIFYQVIGIIPFARYLVISDLIAYTYLSNLLNLNYKNIIFIILLYRFINTYFMIFTGEIFDLLIKFKNIKQADIWKDRINNLIQKRSKNLTYNAIYLSDRFDTKMFLKLYSILKGLNLNFLIMANEVVNDSKLPQNDNFKLIKIYKYNLKQNVRKYIKLYTPEIFITDTTEYFGLNSKKIAFENNIPFLYIPNSEKDKNRKMKKFLNAARIAILNNLENLDLVKNDKIIDANTLDLQRFANIKKDLVSKLNIYNITKLKETNLSILIMDNQNIIDSDFLNHARNSKNKITLFTSKKYHKSKNIKIIKGDFLNQKDLYNIFKKYNFDLVIDLQYFKNSQDIIFAYDLFLNLMISNKCNYHLKVDFEKNNDYIPKLDPIIYTATKLKILNLKYLKLPQISLNKDNIENDLKYLSMFDFYNKLKLEIYNLVNNLDY